MKSANLAVKFLLELAAFAAFAYWGARTGTGAAAVVLAIAAPAAAVVVWGVFAAPRSSRRLPLTARVPLELGVFALAGAALAAAGSVVLAVAFGVVAVLNAVLLTVFHQWEQ
ncbi:MAG: DUF2568 domain-containing protein [Streptosporangiaceae bacterium]